MTKSLGFSRTLAPGAIIQNVACSFHTAKLIAMPTSIEMRKAELHRPCTMPPFVGVYGDSFGQFERGVSDEVALEVVDIAQEIDVSDVCVSTVVVGDDATISAVSVAVSVEGGAVMPIMSAYCEATRTGRSSRSLGSHCTVTWSCSIHSSGGRVVYTSAVDMFGSRRNAIGVVRADVQRYSSSTDRGENPLASLITGLRGLLPTAHTFGSTPLSRLTSHRGIRSYVSRPAYEPDTHLG